jgi:beta-glucosidase
MILALRARGLEPIVTLHHFVLPGWLADRGGLTTAEFPTDFGVFAERVVRRLALGPAHVQ